MEEITHSINCAKLKTGPRTIKQKVRIPCDVSSPVISHDICVCTHTVTLQKRNMHLRFADMFIKHLFSKLIGTTDRLIESFMFRGTHLRSTHIRELQRHLLDIHIQYLITTGFSCFPLIEVGNTAVNTMCVLTQFLY